MDGVTRSKAKIIHNIEKNRIIGVVRTDNAQRAIDISKALIDGGIKIIEITMNYVNAPIVIGEISKISGISVAAGSVVTGAQADSAIAKGAELIVSPVAEMTLIKLCKGNAVPIITGAATPTEAYNAWKLGVNLIKVFPARELGGPDYICDVLTPMPFLPLIPTGGIDPDNFIEYLKNGAVAVGIGKGFYANEESLSTITEKAKSAVQKLDDYLGNK
ncbi:MAG: Keto-hydroxyglutarate-aldolase/keto-deoxy-phosphogluconate aldolase [uncultured bacterium]|nr:MAG: Keto-hydroxyglutarate-aldolase/keto-deoxy-phosphogluconate aldolase [uncultured bacterium]HBH17478.1 2-dehydro-3-deoxyphosphogluconate aldolase [Cyanobacteria bacterium UBA9579]